MIGIVTPDFKAVIHVSLLDRLHNSNEVEVFVDTGFNGDLSLQPSVVDEAGFVLIDEARVQLADGSDVMVAIFAGAILWHGQERQVNILSTNGDSVLGMRLLENSELKIEVKIGGAVTIEPLD